MDRKKFLFLVPFKFYGFHCQLLNEQEYYIVFGDTKSGMWQKLENFLYAGKHSSER